jgi:hypothetical protein
MQRFQWMKAAKFCGYFLGAGNLIFLVFGQPTIVGLGVEIALAPFTLALVLGLTSFLACNLLSFVLGDGRERAELLVHAIGALQPPNDSEKYREAMFGEIRAAPSHLIKSLRINLVVTSPRTILIAWRYLLSGPGGAGARKVARR